MQLLKVGELTPHPQNNFFFDDISGGKWDEFLKSIQTSGVIEPIVITQDKIIVSGHQRVRACKELKIDTILCEVKVYDNDENVIRDLIETNMKQRGTIGGSDLKMGRIFVKLEEIYGIRSGSRGGNGSNQYSKKELDGHNVHQANIPKTQKELAEQFDLSQKQLLRYKKLTDLIPELQELSLTGELTTTIASNIAMKLSREDQLKLVEELGKDKISEMTQKQTQEYVSKIKELENQQDNINELKNKISENEIEQQKLKNRISELVEQGTVTEIVTKEVDKPETLKKIEKLESELKKKSEENSKYSKELIEKHKLLSKAMGESTNYQLISHCSEITLKMLDFIKEMSKYDYMAESFNEIPNATRIEYRKCIMSVKKWADRILGTIDEDNIIDI